VRQAFLEKRWRNGTAWLLVFGILLQPLIAYLVTPWVSQDSRGHYVLLCTLNGLQEVYVDGDQAAGAATEDESCPALKLFNLISSARPVTPFQVPEVTLFAVTAPDSRFERPVLLHQPSVYPIRAPPIV
jgi:hypothetical protein